MLFWCTSKSLTAYGTTDFPDTNCIQDCPRIKGNTMNHIHLCPSVHVWLLLCRSTKLWYVKWTFAWVLVALSLLSLGCTVTQRTWLCKDQTHTVCNVTPLQSNSVNTEYKQDLLSMRVLYLLISHMMINDYSHMQLTQKRALSWSKQWVHGMRQFHLIKFESTKPISLFQNTKRKHLNIKTRGSLI